ncbi:IscS subfamily cysteine desulfurase [Paraliobacillus sediminis]|uniref:IscS subfamily cysteine desulfurase n=1 Tax=Paraliobacillus sediminis TaxID=1885916 RepID=UPI000E3ECAB5|nr:IscS subfamily cysteine desulfurase [Paraliobacillus sediminis]
MIDLDNAATTPISTHALEVYQKVAVQCYGNTNSLHDIGSAAADVLQFSQNEMESILQAPSNSIYFSRGGTDANQLAIQLLLRSTKKQGKHIITTAFEHKSITNYLKDLQKYQGYQITYLPTNQTGEVELKTVQTSVKKDTVLVVVQHVNSEIGAIQPIEEIGAWLRTQNILFHSDGVQAFGKLPVCISDLKVDSYAISSHKVHGPKGIGALYVNPAILGQKSVLHTGTMDIPAIAAFVTAANETVSTIQHEAQRIGNLRAAFISELNKRNFPLRTFTSSRQLPHIVGILFDTIPGDYTMLAYNQAGIAISTGSACSVGSEEPSRMMQAIGIPLQESKHFIRFSFGETTTQNDLDKAIEVCENVVKQWGNV